MLLRNREVRRPLVASLVMGAAGALLAWRLAGSGAAACVAGTAAALLLIWLSATRARHRALARMDDSWRQLDALPGDWGLGVPYARRIAELHGGTLLFLRGAADGCRARLTLPLRQELGLETVSGYQLNLAGSDAVEVELSGVLELGASRTREILSRMVAKGILLRLGKTSSTRYELTDKD